jgi:hypothetical protein
LQLEQREAASSKRIEALEASAHIQRKVVREKGSISNIISSSSSRFELRVCLLTHVVIKLEEEVASITRAIESRSRYISSPRPFKTTTTPTTPP